MPWGVFLGFWRQRQRRSNEQVLQRWAKRVPRRQKAMRKRGIFILGKPIKVTRSRSWWNPVSKVFPFPLEQKARIIFLPGCGRAWMNLDCGVPIFPLLPGVERVAGLLLRISKSFWSISLNGRTVRPLQCDCPSRMPCCAVGPVLWLLSGFR